MTLAEAPESHGRNRRFVAPADGLPDLGQKGDPYAPIVAAFKQRGVNDLRPDTIRQIRERTTSGLELVRALAAAEILREGRTPKKDDFFAEYGAWGTVKREKRTDESSRAFRVRQLRKKLATELGVDEDIMGDLVRTLRIDLFYTPVPQLGTAFTANFKGAVESFLRDFGKYNDGQKADAISRRWNRAKKVRNFYGILFSQPKAVTAAWTPYEMEPICTLARNRRAHHSPITPFDRMVLEGINGNRSDQAIISKIRADVGITVPRQMVNYWRALLMGRITIGAQKTDQSNPETQEPTTGSNHPEF
jgi:hypothetical protein